MLRSGYVSVYAMPNKDGVRCGKCNVQPTILDAKKLGTVIHNLILQGVKYKHLCKICASDLLRGLTPRVLNRLNDRDLNILITEAHNIFLCLREKHKTSSSITLDMLNEMYKNGSINRVDGYSARYTSKEEILVSHGSRIETYNRGYTHIINSFVFGFIYGQTGVKV